MWIFSVRLVQGNDVKKPSMFVFKDMEDYQKNGKRAEDEYNAKHGMNAGKKLAMQHVRHKKYGEGVIMETKGVFITMNFVSVGRKQMNLKVCQDKGLMAFV